MITYEIEMHLHPEPFERIRSGRKTIEARLFDQKRSAIKPGDRLIFISRASGDRVEARVVRLLRSATFRELLQQDELHKFGDDTTEKLIDGLAEYYSAEDERQYGVVGIAFQLI